MDAMNSRDDITPGVIIGYCVIAAGIGQLPAIVGGYTLAQFVPKSGALLLLLSVPAAVLLIAGGIGLLLKKFFGYYLIYLGTFFAGIGGFKSPFIPFIKRFVNIGPGTEDLFLAINLLMIAILVWEHWTRVYNLEPTAQQRQRVAIICLISLGLISISYSRSKLHWETGQKAAVNELPVVGADLQQWRTEGVLSYASSESKLTHGLMLAFSGRSDEKSIQQVAEKHHLQRIENPNASKKFLPLAKTWKLNKSGFQTDFKPDDLYYIGRMKDRNKAVLQIVFSKAEKRFTAEVFGSTLKQVAE